MTLLQYCAIGVASLILWMIIYTVLDVIWMVIYVIFGVIWGGKTSPRLSKDTEYQYRCLAREWCNDGTARCEVGSKAHVEMVERGALVTVKVFIPHRDLPKADDGDN